MRKGVTGFQGARLVQAREGRAMTQTTLANLIGRSSGAISRWEKGDQFPEPDALESLERHLAVPASWFLRPIVAYGDRPYFFRSKAAITRTARNIAKTRLEYLCEASQVFQEWVEWPTVNVPSENAKDYLTIRDEDIETIALNLRKHWKLGVGPITDVILAMENAGVVISGEELGYTNMDGVSKWFDCDARPYVFLARDKANSTRHRFDAAHELGHLVLHRHLDDVEFNSRYSEIERQANLFASAFLLPAESFASEVATPSLETFLAMKPRWKVSIGAMIFRSKQLGIISEEYATRLWKNYSARGWRRGEPGDEKIVFEETRLMSRAVKLLLEEGGFDHGRIVSEVGLFPADIERLCGLPENYLRGSDNKVVTLRLRSTKDTAEPGGENAKAEVVDMASHRKS
ncbi:MAG: hypothetical protein C3F19_05740 [Rhodocyclales bacterium]|nr:MAG: hypothetical protein C3F19_05740 [Rhodocyclales bacterium]